MFSRCYKQKTTKSIANYINELKDLDLMLVSMCNRVDADIKNITKNTKITKHVIRRRLLLKKHYVNIDNRRTQVLSRILQLENLHMNSIQINSLKNVAKAHKSNALNPDDVEDLIDKLATFTDDFNDISERLSEDLNFTIDITDEEIEKELYQEIGDQENSVLTLPTIEFHVPESNTREKHMDGTMDDKSTGKRTTAINA